MLTCTVICCTIIKKSLRLLISEVIKMSIERTVRVDARLTVKEKKAILKLAKEKGCEGITGLLKLLANAKKVNIEI
jgi:hypothetical protein